MQKPPRKNNAADKAIHIHHNEKAPLNFPPAVPRINSHTDVTETWLSTEEVAARLKIPKKTLAVWASAKRGPRYAKIGRFRRYRLCDLIAWEQEQLIHGGGWNPLGNTHPSERSGNAKNVNQD